MEYRTEQRTLALRRRNGISAYRILDIINGQLIFQLWPNSEERGQIPVSMPGEFQVGQYIDLQILKMGKTSYRTKLIGMTPQEFVPANGEIIYS